MDDYMNIGLNIDDKIPNASKDFTFYYIKTCPNNFGRTKKDILNLYKQHGAKVVLYQISIHIDQLLDEGKIGPFKLTKE